MVDTMTSVESSRKGITRAFLVALVGVLLLAAWGWMRARELGELTSLPKETRVGLYQRTLENLATVCKEGSPARSDAFCQEQAELALRFPDCDEACQRLARPLVTNPTR